MHSYGSRPHRHWLTKHCISANGSDQKSLSKTFSEQDKPVFYPTGFLGVVH